MLYLSNARLILTGDLLA